MFFSGSTLIVPFCFTLLKISKWHDDHLDELSTYNQGLTGDTDVPGLSGDNANGDDDDDGDVGDVLTGDTDKADGDQGLTGDTHVPGFTGDTVYGDDNDENGLIGDADANVDNDFAKDREM